MIIIGITGGIATGKSYVSKILAHHLKANIFDSDKYVHGLLSGNQEVKEQIRKILPQVIIDDKIDRAILSKYAFSDKNILTQIENVIHPIVKKARAEFIKYNQSIRKKFVILDIPLLFEKSIHKECDINILVSLSKNKQIARFLHRNSIQTGRNLTEEERQKLITKLDSIRNKQMPDSQKRKLADLIIFSGLNKIYTNLQIINIVCKLNKIY